MQNGSHPSGLSLTQGPEKAVAVGACCSGMSGMAGGMGIGQIGQPIKGRSVELSHAMSDRVYLMPVRPRPNGPDGQGPAHGPDADGPDGADAAAQCPGLRVWGALEVRGLVA